jgi:PLP dependent protein
MSITTNLYRIKEQIPDAVTLVAVSKFHPNEAIQEAYNAGQRHFGESRVQELSDKYQSLPHDIHWHMIGHLQTNKVKQIAAFVSLVHSVDSLKLLETINQEGTRINRVIPCLLQVHIAQEAHKFGFLTSECSRLFESGQYKHYGNIQFRGLMGMATFSSNPQLIRSEFDTLRNLFATIKGHYFPTDNQFCELSMGMSDDYKLALESGSTMVRIGSSIFGSRSY